MFLVFDWWLDVIWLKSHRNAIYGIDFNIVIRILNTPVSTKMAQGQRKWRAVKYIYIYIGLSTSLGGERYAITWDTFGSSDRFRGICLVTYLWEIFRIQTTGISCKIIQNHNHHSSRNEFTDTSGPGYPTIILPVLPFRFKITVRIEGGIFSLQCVSFIRCGFLSPCSTRVYMFGTLFLRISELRLHPVYEKNENGNSVLFLREYEICLITGSLWT